MTRFWVLLGLILACFSLFPSLLATFVFFFAALAISITLYRKYIKQNRESVLAVFMNAILDIVTALGRFLRRIRLISVVEALRFPNYLTLLLKPHPKVKYEKIQIRDDTINIIVYYPPKVKNNGVIVYTHGGGWVMFTARMYHSAVSWIAYECQMVTVSVDYARPPENPFPRPLQDIYYTVLWTQVNASKLGVDSKKVILMGDSSGGNLTAATARLHLDKLGSGHAFPPVIGQVLIYPVLQAYNFIEGSFADRDVEKLRWYCSYYVSGNLSTAPNAGNPDVVRGSPAYWRALVKPDCDRGSLELLRKLEKSDNNYRNVYCFPLLDPDPSDLPPTYVMALSRDTIKDDAVLYSKWLRRFDVPVTYVEESNADHGCMFLFGSDDCALEHLRKIARFTWETVSQAEQQENNEEEL